MDVVVVDSASEPPCGSLVERFAVSVPGLTYIYEPQPGLSRARNIGLRAANTELVAFVDPGERVAKHCVRAHVRADMFHPCRRARALAPTDV